MGDKGKKQIPLRISEELYNKLYRWAEDDFRSVNGQIEFLLNECVKQREKNGKYVSDGIFYREQSVSDVCLSKFDTPEERTGKDSRV